MARVSCGAYNFRLQTDVQHEWAMEMSKERASDLERRCTEFARNEKDFSIVWSTLLKSHALIKGISWKTLLRQIQLLRVHLIASEEPVFDADIKQFCIQ
jgi:hypothetical protein